MFWEEDSAENTSYAVPDDVVDIIYKIKCRCLPLDHAFSFSSAVRQSLDWMDDEEQAGVHLIHGAESGNGWMRPDHASGQLLHLSHRSRMTLRVPKVRVADAQALTGTRMDIEGHTLEVGKCTVKMLSTLPTLFARYVVVPDDLDHDDENGFMRYVHQQLSDRLEIKVRKMLCGRSHVLQHPDGDLNTRSVMLADLEVEESVLLQQQGVGDYKLFGCGLFVPHKGVRAVHEMTADKKS